jgi:putative sterol carrier protein
LKDETNMTNKTVTKSTRAEKDALAKQDEKAQSEFHAKASLSAHYMSAAISDSFTNAILPKADINDVASALRDKISNIQSGDMQPIEAMLIGQAQALQTMFVTLGRMAASKTSLPQYTAFMNMALKAQAQSRATIQALTELKYPKQATFVKQANIAGGNQQVNNGNASDINAPIRAPAHAHARAIENQPNELLSEMNHATMDTSGTTTTSATNQAMATVAT